jgi:hypothetical protein
MDDVNDVPAHAVREWPNAIANHLFLLCMLMAKSVTYIWTNILHADSRHSFATAYVSSDSAKAVSENNDQCEYIIPHRYLIVYIVAFHDYKPHSTNQTHWMLRLPFYACCINHVARMLIDVSETAGRQ